MATYVESYADEVPQLGRVLEIFDETLKLEWLAGCYSGMCVHNCGFVDVHVHSVNSLGPWKTCKKRVGKEMVVWEEVVPLSSVILSPILLTKSDRLKGTDVDKLKLKYNQLQ